MSLSRYRRPLLLRDFPLTDATSTESRIRAHVRWYHPWTRTRWETVPPFLSRLARILDPGAHPRPTLPWHLPQITRS